MKPDWANIIKWWPLLVALFMLILAGAETRFQVQNLINNRQIDVRQWELIRSQGHKIVDHERRLQAVEEHITPDAIQTYGMIRARVVEDHRLLHDHIRNHPNVP